MTKSSRTKKSLYNIFYNLLNQLITLGIVFYSRSVFINNLGIEYLGLQGFFSSVLSILSMAELGIGSAIIYSMYTPINNNDQKKLSGLVNFYKKLYNYIAIIVFILGILILPFLNFMINVEIKYVKIYYFLFLLNSVFSYCFIYANSIVIANQVEYKTKFLSMFFNITKNILQICILIFLKSYFLYVIIQLICTIIQNICISQKAKKLYPFIKTKESISDKEKKEIFSNIRDLLFYKIGGVILNSTDSILISILVGTVWVGYYSNYNLIIMGISTFTSLIFTSLQSSVGNYNTSKNSEEKLRLFKVLDLLSTYIYGIATCGIIITIQDFILMWIGKDYILDKNILFLILVTFYLKGTLYPIWCFRNTTSIFKDTKYLMIYASLINLILSYFLGKKFGLQGILLATVIARLTTTIYFEPKIIYKKLFKKNVMSYYLNQIKKILLILLSLFISSIISNYVNFNNLLYSFLLKGILSVAISLSVITLFYLKTEEFSFLIKKIKK